MYCYHLSWILPLSGAGQCCPNMPIMTLSACISPHRTQVFHLVTTSSLIHASDWLLIITLTSDWLIAQDMIRSPIAGYLNQIADNWCRCRVSRSVSWLWWWLWSHQGPVPAPGHHDHHIHEICIIRMNNLQKAERGKLIELLSSPLCMTHSWSLFSWKQFVLCSSCCSAAVSAGCCTGNGWWLGGDCLPSEWDQLLSPGRDIKPQQCHGVKRLMKVTIL